MYMKHLSLLFTLLISISFYCQVGIGTILPDTNAILDINSNAKGVLFPRLTDVERNAIVSPTEGLYIYNMDNHWFEYYNGTVWMVLSAIPIATQNLYISEYCEGSSFNKYIEIYNPNNTAADLNGYKINIYTNGSTSSTTFTLSGTIVANDVFVICNNNALVDAAITAEADLITSILFNGDDAVELMKGGVSIDVIGVVGVDPGTAWDVAGTNNATLDHVIIRKSGITTGNTNWNNSAGTNATDSEWIVHPIDTFTDIGSHTP